MRRLSAFVLLLLLGLPSALPLFAAMQGGAEASLPACCRRMGKHHCAMAEGALRATAGTTRSDADSMRATPELCPMRCALVAQAHADPVLPGAASLRAVAALQTLAAVQAQTESRWRVARERARGKRGPPAAA